MTSVVMSKEEIDKIMDEAGRLADEGKVDECIKISMKIPLAPHLAMAMKEIHGIDYVKKSGFNLSEAEAKFGKNWLDR